MTEALSVVRRMVVGRVRRYGLDPSDADDIMQEVWLSLDKSMHKFDPSKGSIGAWVNRIAQRRTVDHLNRISRNRRHQLLIGGPTDLNPEPEKLFGASPTPGPESLTILRDQVQRLFDDLREVFAALGMHQESLERVFVCHLQFNGSIKETSAHLNVSPEAMRTSDRLVRETAKAMRQAEHLITTGQEPLLRECLPEPDEDFGHARRYEQIIRNLGGFEHIDLEELVKLTGDAYHTTRQYARRIRKLIETANWVFQRHGITPTDSYILEKNQVRKEISTTNAAEEQAPEDFASLSEEQLQKLALELITSRPDLLQDQGNKN